MSSHNEEIEEETASQSSGESSLTDEDEDIDSTDEESAAGEDVEEIEQVKEIPKDIDFDCLVVGISCHPKKDLIAVGRVDGPVDLYAFDRYKPNRNILSFDHHKDACRAVKFSESGDYLFTASKDTTISVIDLETNSVYRNFKRVNGLPLYTLLPIDNYILAAGEDEGQVVLWDFRMQNPIQVFEDCEDYISNMAVNKEKKILVACSGDGRIASYNVRAAKLQTQSEFIDCELLSLGIFKDGTKLAVGDGDGAINVFNFGEFGNISDRFPNHCGPINSMVVLYDDVACTGCDDGKIRAVQLFPNRILGVLNNHKGFPVEGLALSHDSTLLASCSFDQKIKFCDLSGVDSLRKQDVQETKKQHQQMHKKVDDFFDGL